MLGKTLVHGSVSGRIVETEAYLGLDDPAAHAFRGPTPRTQVLFGPPGHAYVYLIYGMYECLNIVTEPDGIAGCVLIRALEPMTGIATMRRRRPGATRDQDLTNGPGKLTLAMGISRRHNRHDLTGEGLCIREVPNAPDFEIGVSPRIGIREAADLPLRFFIAGNPYVSR